MLITFDFGGASLCHEILHFVQRSQINWLPVHDRGEELCSFQVVP